MAVARSFGCFPWEEDRIEHNLSIYCKFRNYISHKSTDRCEGGLSHVPQFFSIQSRNANFHNFSQKKYKNFVEDFLKCFKFFFDIFEGCPFPVIPSRFLKFSPSGLLPNTSLLFQGAIQQFSPLIRGHMLLILNSVILVWFHPTRLQFFFILSNAGHSQSMCTGDSLSILHFLYEEPHVRYHLP